MNGLNQFLDLCRQFAEENIIEPIKAMSVVDYLDVLMLTIVVFMLIKFVSNRRAGKLATGIFLMVAAYVLVNAIDMRAMKYILSSFYQVGFIAIIIIFQDDLRAALEKVGGISSKIVKTIGDTTSEPSSSLNNEIKYFIDSICDAVADMSKSSTGALIVIEGNTKLGNYIETGTILDASISSLLLRNIFVNRAPLHDGAVIIKDMRIYAAGCKLPLTHNELDASLGTRHRAAIGVSETASDAIVIVVSEETGTISLCMDGEIKRDFDKDKLAKELRRKLGKGRRKNRFRNAQKQDNSTANDRKEEA